MAEIIKPTYEQVYNTYIEVFPNQKVPVGSTKYQVLIFNLRLLEFATTNIILAGNPTDMDNLVGAELDNYVALIGLFRNDSSKTLLSIGFKLENFDNKDDFSPTVNIIPKISGSVEGKIGTATYTFPEDETQPVIMRLSVDGTFVDLQYFELEIVSIADPENLTYEILSPYLIGITNVGIEIENDEQLVDRFKSIKDDFMRNNFLYNLSLNYSKNSLEVPVIEFVTDEDGNSTGEWLVYYKNDISTDGEALDALRNLVVQGMSCITPLKSSKTTDSLVVIAPPLNREVIVNYYNKSTIGVTIKSGSELSDDQKNVLIEYFSLFNYNPASESSPITVVNILDGLKQLNIDYVADLDIFINNVEVSQIVFVELLSYIIDVNNIYFTVLTTRELQMIKKLRKEKILAKN